MQFNLPFDTSRYDTLPISCLIFQAVIGRGGTLQDYQIVYGNGTFRSDWERVHGEKSFLGVRLIQGRLLNTQVLGFIERGDLSSGRAFTTYLSNIRLHVNFQPLTDLPDGFGGFLMTNITDYEQQEGRMRFLRSISQMNNNAILIRQHGVGRLEAIYASDAFAEMMECGAEEALDLVDGMGFFRIAHPEDRPLVRSMLKRRVTYDGGSELTIQLITTSRHLIWCRVHYAFIDDFDEHYIYCTFTDVSLLKRYEERLRSVYTSIGSSFYQMDEHTLVLLRVNLSRDRIEEAKGFDLFPSDTERIPYSVSLRQRAIHYPIEAERERLLDRFDAKKLSEDYLAGRVTVSEVLFSQRRDGRLCYVSFTAALTRHPLSGDMIAFITERECNSEKVREALMRNILVMQFDMVAYLVGGTYSVVIGSKASVSQGGIFPLTRSGSYSAYLSQQVFPVLGGTEKQQEAMRCALALETVRREVLRHRPYTVNIICIINAETFYKRLSFYSVDPEANFLVVLKSDTTALQRVQIQRNEQLRLALKEAQQASLAKTAFLSRMSHEIRTPMNAIIGLNSLVLRDADLPAHTREQLKKIDSSAHHLLEIINDILDMSRIESGGMDLQEEPFSLTALLEQLNKSISGQCQARGLRYTFTLEGSLRASYVGDEGKLRQILLNILSNAVKFTPAPGTVEFHVAQTALFDGQATLRFDIRDSGIGMDAAFLPKLFEPFSQEDASNTNRYGGSGLGMAITKNLVEIMNGNISVQSERDHGTAFTVTVTLHAPESPDSGNAETDDGAEETLELAGHRVLVAEDIEINAEIVRELLEIMDVEVVHAENGQAAVDLFRDSPPGYYDAILMDMRMPVLDGLGATRAIRALDRPDAGSVPIIALTANTFQEDVQRTLQAGMDAHMSKPVEPEKLYQMLSHYFRRAEAERKGC